MSLAQQVVGIGATASTAATSAMPVVPVPYDGQLSFSGGGQANVVLPATPNKRWLVHTITFAMTATAGIASGQSVAVQLIDGTTVIWADFMATQPITATGISNDKVTIVGVAYIGSVNTNMIATFASAPGLNVYQTVSVGAYLI